MLDNMYGLVVGKSWGFGTVLLHSIAQLRERAVIESLCVTLERLFRLRGRDGRIGMCMVSGLQYMAR